MELQMKTKNLLYLLMLVAFLFTACSKDEDKNPKLGKRGQSFKRERERERS